VCTDAAGRSSAWGWGTVPGLGVDVDLPEGKSLTLRGANYSAHLAEGAAKNVAAGLRGLGYKIQVGPCT
jgi:hypothetical protein